MEKIYKACLFVLAVSGIALTSSTLATPSTASAATCASEPTTTTGRVSQQVTVPSSDTYTIWSRIKAPDSNPVEYKAYIDGQCFTIGQTAQTPNTLTWVDYENGSTVDKATVSLTAGTHTLVLTAGTQDLELDRVMLLSDNCTPTGTGDNCNNDTTLPTTSISSPTTGATVSASVAINATASDNDAIDYVEFYRNGSTLLGTDSSSPYSYNWDTTSVSDGSHSLTVRAYDLSGNVRTSTAVNVTVNNNSQPADASITSFSASPTSITDQPGQSSSLSWSVSVGANCTINNGVGAVSMTGNRSVSPTVTTAYQLSCDGLFGGASDSAQATVTVTPAPDTDGDSVKDYIEQAGPNSGDANNDGTPDWQQSSVTSFVNSRTGAYNTLAVTGDCTTLGGVSSAEGNASFLMGVTSFNVGCASAGQDANVTLLLDKVYDTSSWDVLKVNGALTSQTNISAQSTLATVSIAGVPRTALTYTIRDGGALDEDGSANSTIVDPVAFASRLSGVGAPDTGAKTDVDIIRLASISIVVLMALAGLWYAGSINRAIEWLKGE